jgi:hypothetical protein
MAYINYTQNNPIYSPGLATYTTKSEKGDTGNAGFSIYYDDGIIENNINERDRVIQNILSDTLISSTESTSEKISYKTGDLILDGNANIYKIIIGDNAADIELIGCIRQTIGKIYQKQENAETGVISYNVIGELTSTFSTGDNIKINLLDADFNIVDASNCVYTRLINTTTGEIAIFDNDTVTTEIVTEEETE